MPTFFTRVAAAALAALTIPALAACSDQPAAAPPQPVPSDSATPGAGAEDPDAPAADPVAAAAAWLTSNLTDATHVEIEYDGDMLADAGATIDVMWALVAAGDLDAAGTVVDWLAQRQVAIDYAGDGQQAAYPSSMGKLALAYLTPGLAPTPEYQSAEALAAGVAGRLKPEGRFRDISEWGDNSTPMGQAFDIMLLVKLGMMDGLAADPVAGLVAVACDDGSYPVMFDTDPPCVGEVETTAVVAQALMAAGEDAAAERAFDYLLAAQTESGRWQNSGTDSVGATSLAVSALALRADPEAADAAALGLQQLKAWQLPRSAAFPGIGAAGGATNAGGTEGDVRATAQAVLGLSLVSYLDLLGVEPR